MDIREKQTFFSLLLESFRVTNRAGGAIASFFIVYALFSVAVGFLHYWGIMPLFLLKLVSSAVGLYFSVVFLRLLGAKADNSGETIANSYSACVIPAFYFLLYSIFFGAIMVGGTLLLAIFCSKIVAAAVALLWIVLMFRLCYVPVSIALRDQGPVSALIYSWQLTGRQWAVTLAMLATNLLLPLVLIGGIGYALYVTIPLYFAGSFNLAALTLPWYLVGAVLALLVVFVYISMTSFYILVFLNLDYGDNRASFTPEAEVRLADQPTQVFGTQNNILPPGFGKTVQASDVAENLNVQQASLQTHADEVHEHLEQVYTPKQTDHIEYADEDRMPTILFDDEMAKEFEENRQKWAVKQEQKEKPTEPDGGSIKMSK